MRSTPTAATRFFAGSGGKGLKSGRALVVLSPRPFFLAEATRQASTIAAKRRLVFLTRRRSFFSSPCCSQCLTSSSSTSSSPFQPSQHRAKKSQRSFSSSASSFFSSSPSSTPTSAHEERHEKAAQSQQHPQGEQHEHEHAAKHPKYGSRPACWSCAHFIKQTSLFCSTCNKVQPPRPFNYFELLGIKHSFEVDLNQLEKHYWALQRKLHPDKFHQKSETEKAFSEGVSSEINEAYRTLKNPNKRLKYMLSLAGAPLDESSGTITDPELLMEVMEVRGEIEEATSKDQLRALQRENQEKLRACYAAASEALRHDHLEEARQAAIRLQYLEKVEEELKQRL
ncbi:Co-chaperone Hsc20 [Balamuthia mandrillaris]